VERRISGQTLSTLAASVLADRQRLGCGNVEASEVGAWIKRNVDRTNFLIDQRLGVPVLTLFDAYLQCRLRPRYEGHVFRFFGICFAFSFVSSTTQGTPTLSASRMLSPKRANSSVDRKRSRRCSLKASTSEAGLNPRVGVVHEGDRPSDTEVVPDSHVESPKPALALPDKPSIAVLPFENMSGDPEQEYFADGMVEEITTALSRFKWLFVIARNSSFTFKGRAVDIKEVGRRLGVRYVLEGSVRKGSGKVRIAGQLIDAVTGAHIWADRFERDLTDMPLHELHPQRALPISRSTDPANPLASQRPASSPGSSGYPG
jgi:TolB-like protein